MPAGLIWDDDVPIRTDRDGVMAEMDGRHRYFFSRSVLVSYPRLIEDNRVALTEYIRAAGVGETVEISTANVTRIIDRPRPKVSSKIGRLLRSIARKTGYQSEWLKIESRGERINISGQLMRDAGIESISELISLLNYLNGEGQAKFARSTNGSQILLPVGTLIALEQSEAVSEDSQTGFVAMWFGQEVANAFREGIAPAIEANGFTAVRIDGHEHNNKIDDEIIAEIRKSRFVVADFTCGVVQNGDAAVPIPRGGVYYEAGFAQGLGIPVIWCVREDQIDAVHFDTRQFNHIVWSDPDDLRVKLINRIGATIGQYQPSP